MKLIFIYGPPAVGKTTVGAELATLSGYRFFFNHLTIPAAKAIFPDSQQPSPDTRYTKLLQQLRLNCLTAAADAQLNTIFTMAYSGVIDDAYVAKLVNAFVSRGGSVHFVELYAPEAILLQRVDNPERAALHLFGKMTNPAHLREILNARDMYASVKYPDILKLDTSQLKPAAATKRIMDRFLVKGLL